MSETNTESNDDITIICAAAEAWIVELEKQGEHDRARFLMEVIDRVREKRDETTGYQ